jgi:hypothetical protein
MINGVIIIQMLMQLWTASRVAPGSAYRAGWIG